LFELQEKYGTPEINFLEGNRKFLREDPSYLITEEGEKIKIYCIFLSDLLVIINANKQATL